MVQTLLWEVDEPRSASRGRRVVLNGSERSVTEIRRTDDQCKALAIDWLTEFN